MMASLTLRSIAAALGGRVSGGQVSAPAPGHSRHDTSLCVRLSATASDGFTVHSFAGEDPLALKDHVRSRLGLAAWQPERRGHGQGGHPPRGALPMPSRDVPPAPAEPDPGDAAKTERALAVWQAAGDPRGSLAEAYLASRGLSLPWEVASRALRYTDRCPWRNEETGRTEFVPAMLGAFRCIHSERFIGLHRTRLDASGRKLGRRMLGRAAGGAIQLCSAANLGAGLTVAEGIESALAGWQIGWSNAWALGSVGAVASLPVLPFTQSLVILAENDASGANARAVEEVGQRWSDAGREVLVVEPCAGGDLNDAIREQIG